MKNKKDLLGGLIIVVLLLLVLVTYMSFYNYKKEDKDNVKENKIEDNSLTMINIYEDYTTLKVEDKSNIDTNKNIIGSYNCKDDDCTVYASNLFDSLYDDKYIVIKENKKIFIYDFTLNKIVSNLYDDIIDKLNDYLIVKNDYKTGIISKNGLEVVEPIYDDILYNDMYDSYLKFSNNKSYGILDIDNGNVIIDSEYDDIKINDSKYYSVLKDDLWYVIDNQNNIVTNGYDYTFAFNKGFIALIDNNLQILKYNKETAELLNNNVINIYEENGYKISRDGSIITIEIINDDNIMKYEYNINRNNLISK